MTGHSPHYSRIQNSTLSDVRIRELERVQGFDKSMSRQMSPLYLTNEQLIYSRKFQPNELQPLLQQIHSQLVVKTPQ
jgi:hypothetical protein